MATIFHRLVRVSTLTTQRSRNRHCLLQHVKWCHDETHYQHGIHGIPTDGKVVFLKNSNTGSQIYLVGTNHVCKESPLLVKKVIDSIRPDAIAIEYSEEGLKNLRKRNWEPKNVNEDWFSMFQRSMRSPGGLQHKMNVFINNWQERRLQADGIIHGGEFKVAYEESRKLKAKLVAIDQDDNVFYKKFPITIPWMTFLPRSIPFCIETMKIKTIKNLLDTGSRSQARQLCRLQCISTPEIFKVFVEDRDMHMFTRLRRMEEKLIVAVVGMGHMDGIELLWKCAEDDDADKLLLVTSENESQQTGDVAVEKTGLGM